MVMNINGVLTTCEELTEHNFELYDAFDKEGEFLLKLEFRGWNKFKSNSLVCYFTDREGKRYRLFAWKHGEIYNPKRSEINMATVQDGTWWKCTVKQNSKGNMEWLTAEQVQK